MGKIKNYIKCRSLSLYLTQQFLFARAPHSNTVLLPVDPTERSEKQKLLLLGLIVIIKF